MAIDHDPVTPIHPTHSAENETPQTHRRISRRGIAIATVSTLAVSGGLAGMYTLGQNNGERTVVAAPADPNPEATTTPAPNPSESISPTALPSETATTSVPVETTAPVESFNAERYEAMLIEEFEKLPIGERLQYVSYLESKAYMAANASAFHDANREFIAYDQVSMAPASESNDGQEILNQVRKLYAQTYEYYWTLSDDGNYYTWDVDAALKTAAASNYYSDNSSPYAISGGYIADKEYIGETAAYLENEIAPLLGVEGKAVTNNYSAFRVSEEAQYVIDDSQAVQTLTDVSGNQIRVKNMSYTEDSGTSYDGSFALVEFKDYTGQDAQRWVYYGEQAR